MNPDHLTQIGLSAGAAKIYLALIEYGRLPASRLAKLSGIERSMTYVFLKELLSRSLITEDKGRGVTRFEASHPQHLEELVRAKNHEAEAATASFNTVIHQLQQQYEIRSGQPGVRFFDGATGLSYINQQLRHANIKEMFLIRANVSSKAVEDYNELIQEQRHLRIKNKVPLKIIAPSVKLLKDKLATDKENLIERRIIAEKVFDMPAQILIYGNTVAITTYKEPTLTSVIEQEVIATTMKTLFMYIWRTSLAETQMMEKKLTNS